MQSILDQITEWLKEMLISGIMGNLSGMFDSVNQQVGEIAGDVGMTPASFSPAVFSLIRNISESVIVPIAGLILTFIACYELIQMIIEHNNLNILLLLVDTDEYRLENAPVKKRGRRRRSTTERFERIPIALRGSILICGQQDWQT